MKPALSVVIPVCREKLADFDGLAAALAQFAADVSGCHEVLLVDDGNPPQTEQALRDVSAAHVNWRVLRLSRRFGAEAALTAGLDAAQGEAVLVLAGASLAEWEQIPALIRAWREGFDVVRLRPEKEGRQRRLLHWAGVHVFRLSREFPLPPMDPLVFLADGGAVALVRALPERTRYIEGLFRWIGLRQTVRTYGAAPEKTSFFRAFLALWQAVLSFSFRPLDWITWLGLLLGMAGTVWLSVLLVLSLLGRAGYGMAALSALLLLLGGMILGSMGMLGAYLGRIYDEVRGRPMYILAQEADQKTRTFQK